jgi:hypothetical protein
MQIAKVEIEELRMKLNCEYTDKINELEIKNKASKEDVMRKENDIRQMTNEHVMASNDWSKKLALVE